MKIGAAQVTIKPAMFVLVGSIIVGIVGVIAAGWYALGPKSTFGLANPKHWTYAANGGAEATMKMLSDTGAKELEKTRDGYSHVDAEDGFMVTVSKAGANPNNVYIRNVIDVDKANTSKDMTFSFEASSPSSFPIVFTIRDSETKTGGTLLWSQSFTVEGDWKTYTGTVPVTALGHGRIQFMVMAGHLSTKAGVVSLRHIYLK